MFRPFGRRRRRPALGDVACFTMMRSTPLPAADARARCRRPAPADSQQPAFGAAHFAGSFARASRLRRRWLRHTLLRFIFLPAAGRYSPPHRRDLLADAAASRTVLRRSPAARYASRRVSAAMLRASQLHASRCKLVAAHADKPMRA